MTGESDNPRTFNDVLRAAGIDPREVRLARHAPGSSARYPSLYAAWKSTGGQALFEEYQRIQSRDRFVVGGLVASFMVTPPPAAETVFIGLYTVTGKSMCPSGARDPYRDNDVSGMYLYDLERDRRFDPYRERLIIDWGPSTRTWCQHADRQEKTILGAFRATRAPAPPIPPRLPPRSDSLLNFSGLLKSVSLDLTRVRLARHQASRSRKYRSLYAAWESEGGQALLEEYQRIQSRAVFVVGGQVASFIVTPPPANETVFIGLYTVTDLATCAAGTIDPYSGSDVSGMHLYGLERDERFDRYRDRLVVDWGTGTRSWCQHAARQDKPILAIRDVVHQPFPGPGAFVADIDSVPGLPPSWREYLQNTKGIYLLVDHGDGRAYIGSAKGEDSFWGRWMAYAQNKHGGNVGMRARPGRSYQVSILQVVDVDQSDHGIEQLEARWKRKLLTREFGLNLN